MTQDKTKESTMVLGILDQEETKPETTETPSQLEFSLDNE
jgi:hypothetical protein